jgi:RNA-splicing ligase RtcB
VETENNKVYVQVHYGKRRLGEQIAVETGNNKVIK